jgi:hypothetical protein
VYTYLFFFYAIPKQNTQSSWFLGTLLIVKRQAKVQGGYMEPVLIKRLLPADQIVVNYLYLPHQIDAENLPAGLGQNGTQCLEYSLCSESTR